MSTLTEPTATTSTPLPSTTTPTIEVLGAVVPGSDTVAMRDSTEHAQFAGARS